MEQKQDKVVTKISFAFFRAMNSTIRFEFKINAKIFFECRYINILYLLCNSVTGSSSCTFQAPFAIVKKSAPFSSSSAMRSTE